MANLKLRLSVIFIGALVLALALGVFGPGLAAEAGAMWYHFGLAGFIFVGLCGVAYYALLERALNPVVALTDNFLRMQSGDLNPRLPVEGPSEMQRMARAFNETMVDLELKIRDITEEKQAVERSRQYLVEQLEACQQFSAMVDSAPVGVVLADPDLEIVYQNPTSESGLLQLTSFLPWDSDVVVGRPLWMLYLGVDGIEAVLSDPDRLPFEERVEVGPYTLRFLASAVYTPEGDYVGPMVVWDVVEEPDAPVDGPGTEDLEPASEMEVFDVPEEMLFDDAEEMPEGVAAMSVDGALDEFEAEAPEAEGAVPGTVAEQAGASTNGAAPDGRFRRSAELVGRSVRLLSERLVTLSSSVEALCNEGENLRQCVEETRQHAQNAAYLTTERSEVLWELVQEMDALGERRRSLSMLVKGLRKSLKEVQEIPFSVARLADSIEHMAVEARLEEARANGSGSGIRVVVEEVQALGRESVRLSKDAGEKLERVRNELEDVLSLMEEDRHEARQGERLALRAEHALGRIERDLNEVDERAGLLSEMAVGQSEIGGHIADHLGKLNELVDMTVRVTQEQVQLVSEGPREETRGTVV